MKSIKKCILFAIICLSVIEANSIPIITMLGCANIKVTPAAYIVSCDRMSFGVCLNYYAASIGGSNCWVADLFQCNGTSPLRIISQAAPELQVEGQDSSLILRDILEQ